MIITFAAEEKKREGLLSSKVVLDVQTVEDLLGICRREGCGARCSVETWRRGEGTVIWVSFPRMGVLVILCDFI